MTPAERLNVLRNRLGNASAELFRAYRDAEAEAQRSRSPRKRDALRVVAAFAADGQRMASQALDALDDLDGGAF